jgi:Dolichyl-phosphate-mannose-protein mannosyltransferase
MNINPEPKQSSVSNAYVVTRISSRVKLILFIVLAGASVVYYVAISPRQFGSFHDDSIYVTTAKALATGKGYRIISLPYEPAQTKYPPFYPFLLSLIWRLSPSFPQNLVPMMLLSVLATVGFLALSFSYLTREGYATSWEALAVVALTAINWRTMILATSLLSDMIYGVLSILALLIAEELAKRKGHWIASIGLGVVMGLAFLTRSSAAVLIIAVGVYFVAARRFRSAVPALAVVAIFVLGWVGWCHVERTPATGVNVAYYTSYLALVREVITQLQAQDQTWMPIVVLSVLAKNALMLIVVSIPVACLGIDYNGVLYLGFAFLFVAAGFIRDISGGLRMLHVYIISYLILHSLWLLFVSYDRFLIPILPFLLLWLLRELRTMAQLVRREMSSQMAMIRKASAGIIGLALGGVVVAGVYNYVSGVYYPIASGSIRKVVGPSAVDRQTVEWINSNTAATDRLVCNNDPMYYLYTGRKATHFLPMISGINWKEAQHLLFDIVNENKVNYLVLTPTDFDLSYRPDVQSESLKDLIEERPAEFVPVFKSTDAMSTIYRINNDRIGRH